MSSLSEKIFVPINGVEQGMFIQSIDVHQPVLLFLHGGPGMPEYFMTARFPTGLENLFTVCWWEQRGSGLSYHPGMPRETLTLEQLLADTLAAAEYLRSRFGKEKIYLMGHSGGTYLGLLAAAQAPELFWAYLGMGQMTHQLKSEMLAYEYMLEQYRALGNRKMVRRLEAAPPTLPGPLPRAYLALRDDAMHGLGIGTTREMKSVFRDIFLATWQCRAYTFREKVNIWRGKFTSAALLRDPMFAADLTQQVTQFHLPVYFFEGAFDYTCSCSLAKSYFEKLEAPLKRFYLFEQSAHSPLFEEPEKMLKILREDVLAAQEIESVPSIEGNR
jgi:pimeloyl-ACP methyl ester carboxylesterase